MIRNASVFAVLEKMKAVPIVVGALLGGVVQVGCGVEEDAVENRTSALSIGDRPEGFTCGLAYSNSYDFTYPALTPVNGQCMGYSTILAAPYRVQNGVGGPTAPGFSEGDDGDRGNGNHLGFYHQYQSASTGTINPADSDDFLLPKGTACGFQHTCNSSHDAKCFGLDVRTQGCPNGWRKRQSNDASAPNGCNYFWCEYLDPNNLCTGNCALAQQPSGTVCGITDSDAPDSNPNSPWEAGRCLGVISKNSCPSGWSWFGKYDAGRSAGHGTAWCMKL